MITNDLYSPNVTNDNKKVEGDTWEIYIPPELGYGERGTPPEIPGE